MIMKKKDASSEEKLHIISLAEIGGKNSDIAKKLGCNIRTIQRILKGQKRLLVNTPPPPSKEIWLQKEGNRQDDGKAEAFYLTQSFQKWTRCEAGAAWIC
jgi:hypothetical protein